jgi:hypothetical protein
MRKMFHRGHVARAVAGLLLNLALPLTFLGAPQADTAHIVKVRGTILSFQGSGVLSARTQDGGSIKMRIMPQTRLGAIVPASLASIKPGSFVGITSMPGDGSERIALEVHIFPEALRGTGEGDRPWDKGPGSRMTNATVASVAGVYGEDLTLTYRGGQSKIKVTPRTRIVTFAPGDAHDFKPGAHFIAFASPVGPGAYVPLSISVGRNGLTPPM